MYTSANEQEKKTKKKNTRKYRDYVYDQLDYISQDLSSGPAHIYNF